MTDAPDQTRKPWWSFLAPTRSPLTSALLFAIVFGILATAIYAADVPGHWRSFASAAMFAAASLAAGSLLGLLFGVPRSLAVEVAAGPTGSAGSVSTVGANTNLEQISDWLTKVLVGASLVQFQSIGHGLGRLFRAIGPGLDRQTGVAFAGCLVVYYAVVGFFSGWLFARLRLGAAMSTADALLQLSRRADAAGDTATAATARDAANATILAATTATAPGGGPLPSGLGALATQYEQLRKQPSGPRRTSAMEALVRQGRQLPRAEQFTAQDLRTMLSGDSPGQRIMALAIMEGDPTLADPDSVIQAIAVPRSPFEQYHALTVANQVAGSLSAQQQAALREVLEAPDTISYIGTDTSRASLRQRILDQLATASPAATPPVATPPAATPPAGKPPPAAKPPPDGGRAH